MEKQPKPLWILLGPLFVIIGASLWGTETFFRVNLNSRFDSEVLVFHEHLFCIFFTVPFAFTAWSKVKEAPFSSWVYLILSGAIGSAIGTTLFTLSLTSLNPSVANVLLNFQPIITIVFAKLLLREKLGRGFFVWSVLALAAGGLIAADGFNTSDLKLNLGLVYITLTAMAWGFSTVAGRGAMLYLPLRVATAGRFIVGGIAMLITLMIKGKLNNSHLKWATLTDLIVLKNYLWLSVVAGVIPLYFYFKGLSKTSASVSGFCELTQTFSALVLTWGIMKNPLSPMQLVAGLFLLICVYMVNLNFAKANVHRSI